MDDEDNLASMISGPSVSGLDIDLEEQVMMSVRERSNPPPSFLPSFPPALPFATSSFLPFVRSPTLSPARPPFLFSTHDCVVTSDLDPNPSNRCCMLCGYVGGCVGAWIWTD